LSFLCCNYADFREMKKVSRLTDIPVVESEGSILGASSR
jgi:hypothetical protein